MPFRVRRALASAAVVPLLAGAAACGGSGGTPRGDDDARRGVLTNARKGETVDPGDFVDAVAEAARRAGTTHLVVRTVAGDDTFTVEGDVDYTKVPTEMALTMLVWAAQDKQYVNADLRVVDGTVYVRLDTMKGKFWKIDPADTSGPLGDVSNLTAEGDPIAVLRELEPAIEKVAYLGEQDVADRTTDHYAMTLDAAEFADINGLPDDARAGMPKTLSYEVWLGDQGQLARLLLYLGLDARIEVGFSDWGGEVGVKAPRANQITPMPHRQVSGS